MNIKNQIRLSVVISMILVVVISASIVVSYQNMQELRKQETLAADVVKGGYELTYLSNDYLINAEPRARLQWEERYTSLQPIISQLKPGNEEEAQSVAIIRDYNEKTGALFREIPEPGTLSAGAVLFPASYQQVTWSRINVQSQGMIYEAWRLRHLYNDDVSEARFWNNILVLVLMVLMLIIIGVNYLLISRRLVRAIREVNKGSEVFATGNLDYRIPVTRDDEIGGIANRLNTMAEQIWSVTASRDELDREITGRKRSEEQLLLKNNAFESSIAANSIADIRGIITHVNPAFLTLWGYRTAEEAIGHSVSSFFAREEDGLPVLEALNTLGRWEGEFLAQRTDGSTFVTQGIATVIRDGKGEPIGYQSTNLDITDRKRAEEELKASEEKFSTAFKTSPYAITITRVKDGSFIEVNDAFTPITGFTHEEALSGSSVGFGLWADAEDRKRVIATLIDGRAVSGEEFLFRKKNGEIITGLFSARIISLNNEPCILSSINDISDRKRAEELREHLIRELEQKNAELERFTYTVSHDLKSPLITIQGFASMIEDDAQKGDTVQLKKDINRIMSAADTMQELLADVLELSRIGRVVSPPEKIPFGTIAHEAVDLLAGTLAELGVKIDIAPALPIVRVDHARIREVMVNLLENAVKFMGNQQKPEIRIGMETGGAEPVFFVWDNGIGIDPRYLERIFNLFERLDTSAHGTGIGLPIVRRIIEVHGGKIWAESEGPGKGTTFRFTLPGPAEEDHKGMLK